MKNIREMSERHGREIEELQEGCKHTKVSGWLDFMWAPGHFGGQVKQCILCGKTMERKGMELPDSTTIVNE